MNMKEYQAAARRTMQADNMDGNQLLTMGVMGLCGEAAEVIDLVKKATFQGHHTNRTKMAEELGDVLWYVAACCEAIDVDLDIVALMNIEKLKKRYPAGFEAMRSMEREG